jgi:3',5'-cyclic AMP phosphodiesterase CpdA
MRRIVHISDIHFGRADYSAVELVVEKLNALRPDLVVVSGDLTQRARSRQFIEAKRFLDRLPQPQIVVPGNHDVPLYNVYDRFVNPLEKFKRYITSDLTPTYFDDEMVVVGINTARSLTIKGGRINEDQMSFVSQRLCEVGEDKLKIVVTHHPFDLPEGFDEQDIVGRADVAMPLMADCGADMFLSGHLHSSYTLSTAKRYQLEGGRSALVVQAGTATSDRVRGEARSFNVLEFEDPLLRVDRMELNGMANEFEIRERRTFRRKHGGWIESGSLEA